jgi:hypothetical protein
MCVLYCTVLHCTVDLKESGAVGDVGGDVVLVNGRRWKHSSGYANEFWAEVSHYVDGRKLDETKDRMAERGVVGSWKGELDPFEEEKSSDDFQIIS